MSTKWHTKTPDEPDWMPARRRLDAHAVRTGVLVVCAGSSIVLIVRSLFG